MSNKINKNKVGFEVLMAASVKIPYGAKKHVILTRLCYDECNFTPEKLFGPEPQVGFISLVGELYYVSDMSPECSVFYGCSFSRMLLFLLLAHRWPALACRWEQVERVLAHHGYPYHQHHKFNLITTIFLSVAFSE